MRRSPSLVWAILVLLAGGGCAGPRPLHAPSPPPEAFLNLSEEAVASATPAPDGSWWSIFGDAELDRLMRLLIDENPDVASAYRRTEEAVLQSALARTARYPSVDYGFLAERRKNSGAGSGFNSGETRDSFELPLTADYQADLFGRIRSAVDARQADADAVEADAAGLVLALQAELSSAYFGLQAIETERAVLDRAVAVRRKALELTQARFRAGDVSEIDVSLAETELNEVRAERIGLERGRIEREQALAALVGAFPSAMPWRPRELPPTPPVVAANLPSDMLRRRPDVRAAERRIAAEAARVGLARRLHFPTFRLTGSAGLEAENADDLFGDDSETWRATAEMLGPLFNAGADRISRDIADVRYRQAELAYRSTVIQAVRETESALGAIRSLDEQIVALRATADSARRTVALTEKQYRAGLVDFFEVVNAQRTQLRNEQSAVRALADRYQVLIRLIQALGGGW